MSFILDALKKAEAERQRQTGPTLLEVRVTQPRRRFPLWIIIIGALLLINIVLLGLFALRHPQAGSATATSSAVAPAPAAAPTPAPAPAVATPAVSAVASPAAPPAAAPAAVPAVAAPAEMSASADRSSGGSAGRGAGADADAANDNPADFEPAVPASGTAAARQRLDTGQRAEPPSLSDIGGNLPDLRLDLHVYAARPADRYALINMHRVHEGDVLPEGPRVLAIDRDGVELSYRGTEFMLRPQ
jgi:general secretion pathway protein B